jgi:hypothetical protein
MVKFAINVVKVAVIVVVNIMVEFAVKVTAKITIMHAVVVIVMVSGNGCGKISQQNKMSFAANFAMTFSELLQKKFRGKQTNTLCKSNRYSGLTVLIMVFCIIRV